MKKILFLIMLLLLIVVVPVSNGAVDNDWTLDFYEDEYGRETKNPYIYSVSISGTFSDSINNKERMNVIISADDEGIYFNILKYENIPVKNIFSYDVKYYVKFIYTIDGIEIEDKRTGVMSPGSTSIFLKNNYYFGWLFHLSNALASDNAYFRIENSDYPAEYYIFSYQNMKGFKEACINLFRSYGTIISLDLLCDEPQIIDYKFLEELKNKDKIDVKVKVNSDIGIVIDDIEEWYFEKDYVFSLTGNYTDSEINGLKNQNPEGSIGNIKVEVLTQKGETGYVYAKDLLIINGK